MKKYIYIFAAAAALMSCAKEVTTTEEIQNQKPETGKNIVTFTATLETPTDTKGAVGTGGVFTWSDTDDIAVWTNKGRKTATVTLDGSAASFTFELDNDESIPNNAIFVYPAECLTGATTVDIHPFIGDSPATTKGPILAAKIGTGSDRSKLNFKYVCATVEMTITDVPAIANRIGIGACLGSMSFSGTASISFDDEGLVPTLSSTNFTDSGIGFDVATGGSKTIKLPIPLVGVQHQFQIQVMGTMGELFYKNTPALTPSRTSYYKMKDLAINPKVYLKSDMTDWTEADSGVEMTRSNNTNSYSISLNSIGNQYATVYVKYLGQLVKMGPAENGSTTSSQELVSGASTAIKLNDMGTYTFTFDPTTSVFAYEKTSSAVSFYLGTTASYGTSIPFTKLNDGIYYAVANFSGTGMVYYNNINGYGFGKSNNSSDVETLTNNGGITMTDENSYFVFFDLNNRKVGSSYLSSTTEADDSPYAASISLFVRDVNYQDGHDVAANFSLVQGNKHLWTYDWTSDGTLNWGGQGLQVKVNWTEGNPTWITYTSNKLVYNGTNGYQSETNYWWFNGTQKIRIFVEDKNQKAWFFRLPD